MSQELTTNNSNQFSKNGRELQELLGSTNNHTHWAKDQISKLGLNPTLDFTIISETVRGGTKHTYFFTESAAHRIAGHSQVKSDNALMIKDNNVVANLALQGNKSAIIMQAMMFLQEDLAETQKKLEDTKIKLEEKSKDFSSALELTSAVIKENDQLKPKADYTDEVLKADGCFTTKIIASELNMSAQKLNNILHTEGLQYKSGKTWILYSKHLDKGYHKSDTFTKTFDSGKSISNISFKWTQKGREMIHSLLRNRGQIMRVA